jgi:hypothetical protein
MESIEQTFNGTVGDNARLTATVSRNGDLVHKMYLASTTTGAVTKANYGHFELISDVELEIGGQRIDKQTAQWMETWAQLTEVNPLGTEATAADGMPTGTMFQKMSAAGGVDDTSATHGLIHVPLQFWFCRNAGLALPLIALQYHEVKVILTCGALSGGANLQLWADYIYLDTDERRRFAQVSHEYLIEQVQEESVSSSATEKTLNFNHPVKELVVSAHTNGALSAPFAAGTNVGLKLNGHDRFAARDPKYFTRAQVWQHHTGNPVTSDTVAVYSFALKPEEHQPSGTCNFSRIDNAVLSADFNAGVIYAVNYNVLRIMSGMGGLAYSN